MNISLADPRLTDIASSPLDDQSNPSPPVKTPPPVQGQAALSVRRIGDLALFKIGELANGTPIEVQVPILSGQVVFFPERCASQRQVLAMLGIDV